MEDQKLGVIIASFVMVIIALFLVPVIADYTYSATTLNPQYNDSVTTGANNTYVSLDRNGINDLACSSVRNATASAESNLSSTQYTCTAGSGIKFYNQVNATVYVDYTYGADNYVTGSASSRTIISLIPLFFVIGVLLIALVMMYKTGILEMIQGK